MKQAGTVAGLAAVLTFALGSLAFAAEAQGTIQALNPASGQILLDDGSTLTVDRNTKITIEGKEGKLEDLQQGEQVQASYQEENGQKVATSIDISEAGNQSGQSSMGKTGPSGMRGTRNYGSGSSAPMPNQTLPDGQAK